MQNDEWIMLDFFVVRWYYVQVLSGNAEASIRVWRSLVSRLNGVQEALSSNLNTRIPKPLKSKDLSGFFNFSGVVFSL